MSDETKLQWEDVPHKTILDMRVGRPTGPTCRRGTYGEYEARILEGGRGIVLDVYPEPQRLPDPDGTIYGRLTLAREVAVSMHEAESRCEEIVAGHIATGKVPRSARERDTFEPPLSEWSDYECGRWLEMWEEFAGWLADNWNWQVMLGSELDSTRKAWLAGWLGGEQARPPTDSSKSVAGHLGTEKVARSARERETLAAFPEWPTYWRERWLELWEEFAGWLAEDHDWRVMSRSQLDCTMTAWLVGWLRGEDAASPPSSSKHGEA